MTEPTTPNLGLIVPNTGDLVGSWGTAALNSNWTVVDGCRGGVTSISLSSATTIVLTAPAGAITPGAGPTQQQNFMLTLSGAQSGNAQLAFSVPGFYLINNQCTGTTAYLQLIPASGTGTYIGIPQGKKTPVCFDGVNVDFANPPDPGTAYDLHGAISVPLWIQAWKVLPYLPKDGTVYNVASYTALAQILGSTFGGNGVTTFGVPDERSRQRLAWDNSGTANRVTLAGSGINGVQMGAAGGDQSLQQHTHAASASVTDPTHSHVVHIGNSGGFGSSVLGAINNVSSFSTDPSATGITVGVTVASTGVGGSQNMPPTIVSFLALVKT
jgi:microcystin-dependent protein